MSGVLSRLLVSLGIITAGVLVYVMLSHWNLKKVNSLTTGLEGFKPGIPAILYFTTPDCQPCKTLQQPAIQQLKEQIGEGLQVIQVDASRQIDLAKYWGVLTVPTTFVIDSLGRPRRVNHGVALAVKLKAQLEEVETHRLPDEAEIININKTTVV